MKNKIIKATSLVMSLVMACGSGAGLGKVSLAAAGGGAPEIEMMEEEEFNTLIEIGGRVFIISSDSADYDVYGVREGRIYAFEDQEEKFEMFGMEIYRKKILEPTAVISVGEFGTRLGRYIYKLPVEGGLLFIESDERFDVYEVFGEDYRCIQSRIILETQVDNIMYMEEEDSFRKWLMEEEQLHIYSMEVTVDGAIYRAEGGYRLNVVVYDADLGWGVFSLPKDCEEYVVDGGVSIVEGVADSVTMMPVSLEEYWEPMDALAFEERPIMYLYRIPDTDTFIMGEGGSFTVNGAEIEAMKIVDTDFFMEYVDKGLIGLGEEDKIEAVQEFSKYRREECEIVGEEEKEEKGNYNTGLEVKVGERKCVILSHSPSYYLFRPGRDRTLKMLAAKGMVGEFLGYEVNRVMNSEEFGEELEVANFCGFVGVQQVVVGEEVGKSEIKAVNGSGMRKGMTNERVVVREEEDMAESFQVCRIKGTDIFVISEGDIDCLGEGGKNERVGIDEIRNMGELERYLDAQIEEISMEQERMMSQESETRKLKRDRGKEVEIEANGKIYKISSSLCSRIGKVSENIDTIWGRNKLPARYVYIIPESDMYVISVVSFKVYEDGKLIQDKNSDGGVKADKFMPVRSKKELAEFLGVEYTESEEDQRMMSQESETRKLKRDKGKALQVNGKTYRILSDYVKIFEAIKSDKGIEYIDCKMKIVMRIDDIWGEGKEPNRYVYRIPDSNVYVISRRGFCVYEGEKLIQDKNIDGGGKADKFAPVRSKEELADYLEEYTAPAQPQVMMPVYPQGAMPAQPQVMMPVYPQGAMPAQPQVMIPVNVDAKALKRDRGGKIIVNGKTYQISSSRGIKIVKVTDDIDYIWGKDKKDQRYVYIIPESDFCVIGVQSFDVYEDGKQVRMHNDKKGSDSFKPVRSREELAEYLGVEYTAPEEEQVMIPVNVDAKALKRDRGGKIIVNGKTYQISSSQTPKVVKVIKSERGIECIAYAKPFAMGIYEPGFPITIDGIWGQDKKDQRYAYKIPESDFCVISISSFDVYEDGKQVRTHNGQNDSNSFAPVRSKEELAEYLKRGDTAPAQPQVMMPVYPQVMIPGYPQEINRRYVFEIYNLQEDPALIELARYYAYWCIPMEYAASVEVLSCIFEEGKLKMCVILKNNPKERAREFLDKFIEGFMEGRNTTDFYDGWMEFVEDGVSDDAEQKQRLKELTIEDIQKVISDLSISCVGEATE